MTAELHLEDVQRAVDVEQQEHRPQRVLPAEWAPQSAVQLTWPHADTDWRDLLAEVTETYVRLAYEIASRQPLLIVSPEPDEVQSLLSRRLPAAALQNVHFVAAPSDDTWARDHAFLTVLSDNGAELLDFRFNGWGGKFAAERDNAINHRLFDTGWLRGHYVSALDFELEGGAIESDGAGTLLTENGYRGFANFDVKIDPRDGRAVFFEVNPRIGRNNWYMAAAGANPMIPMVADLIDGQACEQTQAKDEILYTLVPDSLLLRYIIDTDLRARVKRIIREGRRFDLLLNPTEKDPRRNLTVWLQKQNHRRKFARYYPKPTETSY